jgi:hypothetical protein
MAKKPALDEPTRQLAERLLRMPPKPHDEMKVGRKRVAAKKRVKRKKKP